MRCKLAILAGAVFVGHYGWVSAGDVGMPAWLRARHSFSAPEVSPAHALECPLWVVSRHNDPFASCPLYPPIADVRRRTQVSIWLSVYQYTPWQGKCVTTSCAHSENVTLEVCNWFANPIVRGLLLKPV